MTVGERLQSYRKQHNLSQEELAKQLFVTRQTISLWETDQTLPTIDNLVRLKDILEVSIDDILTGPQDKPEEANLPLESYEFKYSKPIFKSVFKITNSKSFWTHLVLTLLLILNTARTYFVVTDDVSKGLYWGFTIIAVIFFIRYIIGLTKAWSISINNALKNTYKYDVFDGCIRVTVTKGDETLAVRNITSEGVSRCWSTKDLYIFEHQKVIYCLKKQCLNSNSYLHFFFYKGKKFKQKNTNALSITSNIFFVLSFLTIFAGIICTAAMSASNNLYYENMWVFFLFLPIPIVSIILGVLKLKRREKGTNNIVAGLIMAFLLIIYGSFSFIYEEPETVVRPTVDIEIDEDEEVTAFFDYISEIEKTVKIDLPDSAVITDISVLGGNESSWNEDQYYAVITLKISDYDAQKFEKDQMKFEFWTAQLRDDYDQLLPSRYRGTDADYYLLYNTTYGTYNTIPTVDGKYRFWYLCYYTDENCFKAIDYTISYYTEHKSLWHSSLDNNYSVLGEALEATNLNGCEISEWARGNVESTNFESDVYLVMDERYNTAYHDLYLVVENKSQLHFYDLYQEDYPGAYNQKLYLADLDGDGIDEIIINRCIALTGGAGGYLSQIFKFDGTLFYEFFDSCNTHQFNTGFTSKFENEFKLEVSNIFTGYKTVLNFRNSPEDYRLYYWQKDGKVLDETALIDSLMLDSFCGFEPKDIDKDGIYEIVCTQYTSLMGHSDYTGDAKTVLKYNEKYKTFEVIDAEFIPYEE